MRRSLERNRSYNTDSVFPPTLYTGKQSQDGDSFHPLTLNPPLNRRRRYHPGLSRESGLVDIQVVEENPTHFRLPFDCRPMT